MYDQHRRSSVIHGAGASAVIATVCLRVETRSVYVVEEGFYGKLLLFCTDGAIDLHFTCVLPNCGLKLTFLSALARRTAVLFESHLDRMLWRRFAINPFPNSRQP